MLNSNKYKEIVDSFYKELLNAKVEITGIKLSEDKWSLKEIIGHLIDSASNNHQRFVRLQFGDVMNMPAYEGEEWVKVQIYNNMDWDTLVKLWYTYNKLLLHITENADESMFNNVWVKNEDTALTLEFLIDDYYKHLGLHIEQYNNRIKELI